MNQIKIGSFVAACRREKGLSQLQLAEKLHVTDKAISKWERGAAMPDSAIMLELCEVLGINTSELLRGERSTENESDKNEQLLLELSRELQQKNKTIWSAMWVLMSVSITALLGGLFVAALLIPEGVWQLVVILATCVLFLIPCLYALKLEVSVGAYRCKHCGNEIVPTYKEAMMAMHRGTTRYLKCPQCQQRSWCKKVLKK